jgi:hypothetical protein
MDWLQTWFDVRADTALVKADPEAGVIAIWVTGNGATRRDFLNVIHGHFEHIHCSLKRDVAEFARVDRRGQS